METTILVTVKGRGFEVRTCQYKGPLGVDIGPKTLLFRSLDPYIIP